MHFDLIVIGSGSGNSILTPEWDGKKVAIIEAGVFGGTCLNMGCIPTKMYVYPSMLSWQAAAEGPPLGVETRFDGVHWAQLRNRIFGRIDPISIAGRDYRARAETVTLVEERVRFTGPKTLVTASGTELSADQIVIAAGSHALLPDVPGIDLPQVHTSDTVMRIDDLPSRILIVGGGVIAAEFASVFAGFGSKVTQIVRGDALLRSMDAIISEKFTQAARRQWRLETDQQLQSISSGTDNAVQVQTMSRRGEGFNEEFDLVLIAIGRRASTAGLDVAAAGFDTASSGILRVDDFQRVLSSGAPVPGVWALGDIANDYQLKHVANHEARVVAHNAAHPDDLRPANHHAVPEAVFSHPQIAAVGMTSAEAAAHAEQTGAVVVEYVQDFGSTAYGWAMEDRTSVAKVIAEKNSRRLLGAHIIGPEASMLIQPLIQAMALGTDLAEFARGQYWIHPALTEVVENAVLGLDL